MSRLGPLLETRSVRTPLALRLLDPHDDRPLRGLVVTAHATDGTVSRARGTASGAYAFHEVPGIVPLVDGRPAPAPRTIVVHVADPAGRFVPATFRVEAPADTVATPGADVAGHYLFPASGAPARPGRVVVRADVVDADAAPTPAAHAVVTVTAAGVDAAGIADADGRVAIPLAVPPVGPAPPSPDPPGHPIEVEVRWEPAAQERIANVATPTFTSLLAQREATVVDLVDVQLRAGESPVLRSNGLSQLRVRIE